MEPNEDLEKARTPSCLGVIWCGHGLKHLRRSFCRDVLDVRICLRKILAWNIGEHIKSLLGDLDKVEAYEGQDIIKIIFG